MSKKKHKKIDWRAAAEALVKADQSRPRSVSAGPSPDGRAELEKPREVPQEIGSKPHEAPPLAEASEGEGKTTSGPKVKGEIKKIGGVVGLLVLIFIGTIILDRTTSLPSVFAGKVMVFLHLEQNSRP